MNDKNLHITDLPQINCPTMLLAFNGWMDGGDVSTGTIQRIIDQTNASRIAHIDPEHFYIFNFPGAMELAAVFRPHIHIEDGRILDCELPTNAFYCDPTNNLVLFVGKEPNLRWRTFGDLVFDLAKQLGVWRILFVGSFAGSVPHTREPRLYATVSDPKLMPTLSKYGVRPSNYEGPGSFVTYLMTQADTRGVAMISLVAEIPAYLQGINPLSIEAVTRRLAGILDLKTDLAELRGVSDEWESQVSDLVEKDDELAEKIRELEKQYDDDLIESPPGEPWGKDEDQ